MVCPIGHEDVAPARTDRDRHRLGKGIRVRGGVAVVALVRGEIRLAEDDARGHPVGEGGQEDEHAVVEPVGDEQPSLFVDREPVRGIHSEGARGKAAIRAGAAEVGLAEDQVRGGAGGEGRGIRPAEDAVIGPIGDEQPSRPLVYGYARRDRQPGRRRKRRVVG